MKHKLCAYIERYGGCYQNQSQDTRSHYYTLCCRKIRVSDHLSKNTTNIEYQIILLNNGQYLMYHVPTGTVYSCNYNEIKAWIRSFKYFTMYGTNQDAAIIDTRTVLGVNINKFSSGQIKQIEGFIAQLNKKK